MKFHRHKRLAAALTICLGLAFSGGTALSASTMTIGLVKPNDGYIVLDDRLYLLTPATRVLSGGVPVAATTLRKGMKVTIQVQSTPSGSRPVLEEIRISP